jgi:membrane-bound serine protease (ClpP class)
MHAWLAFIVGVLVALGGLLVFGAATGTTYYGITIQIEAAAAGTFFVIAVILTWIIYVGVKAQYKLVKTGKEALIGAKGVATTDLKPKGEIRVMGEFWQATSKTAEISNGEAVEVTGMDGMFLVVKPAEQKA